MKLLMQIISYIFGYILKIRSLLYKYKIMRTYRFIVPIVSVGNICSGGSGKTPFVLWLSNILCQKYNVCVISRGYNRHSKETIIVQGYDQKYDVNMIGDEPLMLIKKNKKLNMVIGDNKVKSIGLAIKKMDIDIILLDDGFQSQYIYSDLDVVMFNESIKRSLLQLIPLGVLREPIDSLNRSDLIVCTRNKTRQTNNIIKKYKKKIYYADEKFSIVDEKNEPVNITKGGNVMGVCGIGDPESFFCALSGLDVNIVEKYIAKDHFNYNKESMKYIYKKISAHHIDYIVTTWKDFDKLNKLNYKHIKIT